MHLLCPLSVVSVVPFRITCQNLGGRTNEDMRIGARSCVEGFPASKSTSLPLLHVRGITLRITKLVSTSSSMRTIDWVLYAR